MANFSTWSRSQPSDSSQLRDFPALLRSEKSILEETLNTEHYFTSSSATSAGQHRPGSARIYSGTSSSVSTTGDDGRLMWDTTNKQLVVLNKSGISRIPSDQTSSNWSALQTFSAGISFGNETLSAYDEGTWTPAVFGTGTAGTNTYGEQTGTYTRSGNHCTVIWNVGLSAKGGTIAGDIRISGLPFPASGTRPGVAAIEISSVTIPANYTYAVVFTVNGQSYIAIRFCGNNVSSLNMTADELGNNSGFGGTLTYKVS